MNRPLTDDTLSVASINLLLFVAKQQGADADALAHAVGISPQQRQDPDGRVLIRQIQALWREVIAATSDPDLALRLGELINPVSIGVLAT